MNGQTAILAALGTAAISAISITPSSITDNQYALVDKITIENYDNVNFTNALANYFATPSSYKILGNDYDISNSERDILSSFINSIVNNTIELEPEYSDFVNKNFWKLI